MMSARWTQQLIPTCRVHWWGDVVMQSEWIKDKDINGKLIYGPQAVISTATSQDIKGTFFIADAWTMAASAICESHHPSGQTFLPAAANHPQQIS